MPRRISVRLHEALDARYLYRAGRHTLAGTGTGHGNDHGNGPGEPLSDHALLSLRIPRPS